MQPTFSNLGSWAFGADSLRAIRQDSLGFYNRLHNLNQDAVRIRLGPYRCWFLFHPDLIEQVLAKQADAFIRFEKMMNVLRQWNGESLLIAEGDSWKERRRKVLPAFKQQRLPEYAQTILKSGQALRDHWCKLIEKQGQYSGDIDAEMAAHSLDIAALTLFGEPLQSKARSIGETVHALSELAFKETTAIFKFPDFVPLPSKRRKREIISSMRTAIRDIVTARLAGNKEDQGDLLSMLIEHHSGNQQAIEEDSMSLLIAGHETSGATLTWLFILLAQHPEILARVQQELDEIVGSSEIKFSMLQRLPYLSAVVQETMRLYPAAYALFSRRATQDVDLGNGIVIKRGDLVQILPYVTQRDARWFDAPEVFKPERFINEPKWPRYAYVPFGAGPRVCIGQSFGFMEVMLTAAIILQRVKPCLPDTTAVTSPRFSLRPKTGFQLSWTIR
jgi:cytochrome P450